MSASPQRHPELDGIRGIAILAVLFHHCTPLIRPSSASSILIALLAPGWAGVELFFVLSGFLITGILLRTKDASNYFRSFYARRFLRIFPIYYLTLSAILLISTISPWMRSMLPGSALQRASYYLYLQNWPVFWTHGFFKRSILGHFWSLAVEEQFYLAWPVLIWLVPERLLRRLCLIGLPLALAGRIALMHQFGSDFGVMNLTTSRIDGLLIGCFLALQFRRGPIRLGWCFSMCAVGCALIEYVAIVSPRELSADIYMYTIGVTGFALLSGALVGFSQHRSRRLMRLLCARWLRTFGKYSYGMYVYHIPIYLIAEMATSSLGWPMPMPLRYALPYGATLIAVTFGVSRASYVLLEDRILSLKSRFDPKFGDGKTSLRSSDYALIQPQAS
jgi:peptidoglycan/LPS O-acetylase OafA/YrhL